MRGVGDELRGVASRHVTDLGRRVIDAVLIQLVDADEPRAAEHHMRAVPALHVQLGPDGRAGRLLVWGRWWWQRRLELRQALARQDGLIHHRLPVQHQ